MSNNIPKDKIQLNKYSHSVRAAQAVLQYGVGAMVNFPDQTLMTAAPEYWKKSVHHIHDERMEKALGVSYFGMPGSKDEFEYREGISYTRFPEWYFCPKCRKFQPLKSWIKDYIRLNPKAAENDPYMVRHLSCPHCRQELVVARLVVACDEGHIDDFPWVKWVHCKSFGGNKKVCSHPTLKFITNPSSSEGLESLEIRCENCGAKATLKEAFDKDKFKELDEKYNMMYDFKCTGRHPWKNTKEDCHTYPKVLLRGSSSVYFPVTASSLVIPPYSSILTKKIDESVSCAECKIEIKSIMESPYIPSELKEIAKNDKINEYATKIAKEISAKEDAVKAILLRKWSSEHEMEGIYSVNGLKYRAEEYEALSGSLRVSSDDYDDFLRESTDSNDYKIYGVKTVSLIHKIREVQALIGFTRLKPAEKSENTSLPARVVSIKSDSEDWYPAYQVRGEGIFIEFDNNLIASWANNNSELEYRINILNENYTAAFIKSSHVRKITAKFVLLHTLAHLLIKQLSFECGYSIASLKERIYCGEKEDGKEMAGILIYTASGDSEGTMGGLVRQGRSDVFPRTFNKAIQTAMACSNDPVCSLSQGQGRDSLNLSACYSCTLIPETSCEEFNVLLDRATVSGTYKNKSLGFYSNADHLSTKEEVRKNNEITQDITLIAKNQGLNKCSESYSGIWSDILTWCEKDEYEEIILKDLVNNSNLFLNKEKPFFGREFIVPETGGEIESDLCWERSKLLVFTKENEDDYLIAQNSEWNTIYLNDSNVTLEKILSMIKEI